MWASVFWDVAQKDPPCRLGMTGAVAVWLPRLSSPQCLSVDCCGQNLASFSRASAGFDIAAKPHTV